MIDATEKLKKEIEKLSKEATSPFNTNIGRAVAYRKKKELEKKLSKLEEPEEE